MVASRVTIQIDDLLSVVNDAQLKSALNTYQEIMQLIKQASEQKKRNVGDKLTVGIRIKIRSLSESCGNKTGNRLTKLHSNFFC
jgi:hypothetical protein